MKAEFHDEQGMLEQKGGEVGGRLETLTDAEKEGIERGRLKVRGAITIRRFGFPAGTTGPLEQREKGTSVGDNGITFQESGDGGLAKTGGWSSQSVRLLLYVSRSCASEYAAKGVLAVSRLSPSFSGNRSKGDTCIPFSRLA
jgi:hypothetical protein